MFQLTIQDLTLFLLFEAGDQYVSSVRRDLSGGVPGNPHSYRDGSPEVPEVPEVHQNIVDTKNHL